MNAMNRLDMEVDDTKAIDENEQIEFDAMEAIDEIEPLFA